MENKYVSFEVYRPVKSPTEKGEYMGKTPNLEQARRAAEIPECSRNWGRTFLVYPAGRTTGRYLWQAAYGYRSRRQAH